MLAKNRHWILAAALPLALAGCDNQPTNKSAPEATENAVTVNATAPANAKVEAPPSPLDGYVGKLASDPVNGKVFLDESMVKDGVAKAVKDEKIQAWVLKTDGPSTPIFRQDGKIMAWGCEQHNCPHERTIAIDPADGQVDVCYKPSDTEKAVWYLGAGGTRIAEEDRCPSEPVSAPKS